MSVFKEDYWISETQELSGSAELQSISITSAWTHTGPSRRHLRTVKNIPRHIRRVFLGLFPNSVRSRLLLAPIAGPVVAYGVLLAMGDVTAPQWTLGTFALATGLGLVISAVVVRQLLQPLAELAAAANRLGINSGIERLPETGPSEACKAAKAFNAMSERMNRQVEERIRLLTAFSHDMQTPITRMRLRVELAEQFPEREKLLRDLGEAERLVRDGIAYARNSHVVRESDTPVDLCAFIESIVFDYQDTGRDVCIVGNIQGIRAVKPAALRRVLSNFIDNALKFAGAGQITVTRDVDGRTSIAVMDRGPGIDPQKLDAVVKPFVRLQQCNGEHAPGVGLGLAIAQQLAREMNASLVLENRVGGGLSAQIVFAAK